MENNSDLFIAQNIEASYGTKKVLHDISFSVGMKSIPFPTSKIKYRIRRLRNATSRINTAFFCCKKEITPHWIWYNRVD